MVPPELRSLISDFRSVLARSPAKLSNRTVLQSLFIDPLFSTLGWPIADEHQFSDFHRERIQVHPAKLATEKRSPNYSYHVGGQQAFFLTTCSLEDDLREGADLAFQVRRYGWSANHNIGIATNFRELAIYDCRTKPNKADSKDTARICYLQYGEYDKRWDELEELISYRALLSNSLEQCLPVATGSSRSTAKRVAEELLREIEQWRESLARTIASRNPQLQEEEVRHAVQLTIDRLLFLRICEDRGIEPYGQLRSLVARDCTFQRLCEIFSAADVRYNSGLFHSVSKVALSLSTNLVYARLDIDDQPLQLLLERLYYPHTSIEFSVLSPAILGHVYEQFLGKAIHVSADAQVIVEDKPEVRKAGGVYYTPPYIVSYIVQQTLAKLLDGKTPEEAAEIKLADPACGAGSFLLGSYDYLLEWHRNWYVANGLEKHRERLFKDTEGNWRLRIEERKRVLLNSIFGVDLDEQAVEVTRLSLLLKVLEDETAETLAKHMRLTQEGLLPDLSSNIKCGNALIGLDFQANRQLSLFEENTKPNVKVFDWQNEFPQVFKGTSGFSAIIGNPPYIRVRTLKELYPEQVDYLQAHYECATHVWDVYLLFFERALELLRAGGLLGFIVPVQTLHQPNCESLRRLLHRKTAIRTVADLSYIRVFEDALVKNCILVCEVGESEGHQLQVLQPKSATELLTVVPHRWPQEVARRNPGYSLKVSLLSPEKEICDKLRAQSWELEELCYVTFGLRSCAREKGGGSKSRLITVDPDADQAKPYMEGRDIGRYRTPRVNRYIRYLPHEMYSPRSPALFERRKIISQSMLSRMRLVATLDASGSYVEQSLLCITEHDDLTDRKAPAHVPLEFILGVINSRLQSFYFASWIADYSLGGGLVHATPGAQSRLLVPKASAEQIRAVVAGVENLLELHGTSAQVTTTADKNHLQKKAALIDATLDRAVCQTFGLTEKEIAFVYKATASATA